MTDSRFPGTTELLSAASVELKGVRANLEEQVRICGVFMRGLSMRSRRERYIIQL